MKTLLFITLLSWSSLTFAATGGTLRFQPIVGLERVQKLSPVVKTKTRTIFGGRFLLGPQAFSLEAELTRSDDTEFIAADNLTEKEKSTAAKLGFRSGFSLGFLRFFIRAGGHARQSKLTTTQNGVTTESEPAIYVSPYAGSGLGINLAGNFFANAGVTVIFTGRPKGSDREYQTTLGFGVRI